MTRDPTSSFFYLPYTCDIYIYALPLAPCQEALRDTLPPRVPSPPGASRPRAQNGEGSAAPPLETVRWAITITANHPRMVRYGLGCAAKTGSWVGLEFGKCTAVTAGGSVDFFWRPLAEMASGKRKATDVGRRLVVRALRLTRPAAPRNTPHSIPGPRCPTCSR
jgi:hypothetical protein